jgi:hypothetical protein
LITSEGARTGLRGVALRTSLIASSATLFVGFLLRHHNYFYTLFWCFLSFLLVFLTISVHWRAVAVPVVVLVLFVPQ